MAEFKFKRLPLSDDGQAIIKGGFSLKSPRNLVFISQKKVGKTLTAANKPKILILDAEEGTFDFGWRVHNKVNIKKYEGEKPFTSTKRYGWLPTGLKETVDELRKANDMTTYTKLFDALEEKGDEESYKALVAHINKMPFPIVMIDTITSITEVSNSAALHEYNENVASDKQKTDIKRVDEYSGVRYTRRKFAEIKMFLEENAAPFIIYAGHIAEKKKIFKKSEEDILTIDIDLEGIQSSLFTVKAAAIGVFVRNDEGCFIDFTKRDETDFGIRNAFMSNKLVKVADFVSSDDLEKAIMPKTFWSSIYPEIKGLD